MRRLTKRLEMGTRWLGCGGRLFARNPWLLGGMGFVCAAVAGGLVLIPLAGELLIALLAPILLASFYLAVDSVSRLKMSLPAALRLAAIKQSPKELVGVFRNEANMMPMIVASLYSMTAVLLINLAVRLVAGGTWVGHWMSLDILPLLGVLALGLLVLALYFVLAVSLVYALPLMCLQNEAPIVAIGRSLKTGIRHLFALVMLLGLLLLPFVLGRAASYISIWVTFLVWLIVGTVVFPLVTTSLYCSYRTLFPSK